MSYARMRSGLNRILTVGALFVLSMLSALGAETSSPKFIFLFIGDGMGFEQVRLADSALKDRDGSQTRMTRLPVAGQIHTRSANREITDSAAAGTALACGVKTDNGRIGQLPDGTPVEPVSLKLLQDGMMIGILTSVTANHATPAPYYSHADNRNQYESIAMQFIGSGVHFLAGRGLAGGSDVNDRVISAYRESGISVVTDYANAADVSKDQRMALLDASVGSPEKRQGDLANVTALAIERMKDNPAGFFMMIEGGAIDWVCHANRGWACVDETLAMDRAVEVAYNFYLQNPQDTLIVVTADHETGGLSVDEDKLDLPMLRHVEQQRGRFAAAIPAEAEMLTMDAVLNAIEEYFGITELTERQQQQLEVPINRGNRNVVVRLAVNVAQAAAGITWSTGGHTDVDVPVYAIGAGAERFRGTYDITQIPTRIFEAAVGRESFAE